MKKELDINELIDKVLTRDHEQIIKMIKIEGIEDTIHMINASIICPLMMTDQGLIDWYNKFSDEEPIAKDSDITIKRYEMNRFVVRHTETIVREKVMAKFANVEQLTIDELIAQGLIDRDLQKI